MRDFSDVRRVVVKVGTNILAPDGGLIDSLAAQVAVLRERGFKPLLVSSGAIGFGSRSLKLPARPDKIEFRQACAAVGQPILMKRWRDALEARGITTAQILLGRESFDDRRSYLNLQSAVESLLSLGVVPVFNENDSVSTAEIGDVFGDNDTLSAHIASKLDAELLVLLTDIDALYDRNPNIHPDAHPITLVEKVTDAIRLAAGGVGTAEGTGGMHTKIQAVNVAARAGCRTVLADGRVEDILPRVLSGEELGTLFLAGRRIGARPRWILGVRPKGTISVDEGALAALARRKSLLPSGITGVTGVFGAGDVVRIEKDYQAVTLLGSEEIQRVMGRHSSEAGRLLGGDGIVARAEDIVAIG